MEEKSFALSHARPPGRLGPLAIHWLMKIVSCLAFFCSAFCTALAADEDIRQRILARSKNLADQPNYSWVSTSKSAEGTLDWRQGPTHGQTEKSGPSYVKFTLGDRTIEMAFQGDKAAIKWEDQWHGLMDLKDDLSWVADRLKTYLLAAHEASFLASHATALKEETEGAFSGQLDDQAIAALLSRGRNTITQAPNMKGTVKFWIKNDLIVKYEFNVQGQMKTAEDQPEAILDRTTVVEINQVGSTQVSLPEESRRKLM